MKLNNYGEFYIECNSAFETNLIDCVVNAYSLGAKQKYDEISVNCADFDYVTISATDRGKAIFTHLLNIIQSELNKHDDSIRKVAIAQYKREHGIKD